MVFTHFIGGVPVAMKKERKTQKPFTFSFFLHQSSVSVFDKDNSTLMFGWLSSPSPQAILTEHFDDVVVLAHLLLALVAKLQKLSSETLSNNMLKRYSRYLPPLH